MSTLLSDIARSVSFLFLNANVKLWPELGLEPFPYKNLSKGFIYSCPR